MRVPRLAAALLPLMASSAALAQHPLTEPVETMRVSFSDLDLSTNEGVDILYGRLTAAASLVCDVVVGVDFVRQTRARLCFQIAMTDASDQLDGAVADGLERKSDRTFASGGQ